MQNILIDKEDSFVVYFYDTYVEIERKGRLTQKIAYKELVSCKFKKGKREILATIFVVFISLITSMFRGIKMYKANDQLLIALKNKKTLSYRIHRDIDKNKINRVVHLIRQEILNSR
ncbi:MAG: hypothetical protein ACWIPJ_08440 [Polaribacter sp.]